MRSLKALAWSLLAATVLAFIAGLVLDRLYLCGQSAPWAFLVSLAFGALSALLWLVAAVRQRSLRIALGAAAVAAFTGILLVLSMAVTLPGCSGV